MGGKTYDGPLDKGNGDVCRGTRTATLLEQGLFSDWEGSIQPVIDQVVTSLHKDSSYVLDIKGWE